MFINCPNCGALVATNLATDLPPERCPSCRFGLLDDPDAAASSPGPAAKPAPAPTTRPLPAFVTPPLATPPSPAPAPSTAAQPVAPVFVPLRPARSTPDLPDSPEEAAEASGTAEEAVEGAGKVDEDEATPTIRDASAEAEQSNPAPAAAIPAIPEAGGSDDEDPASDAETDTRPDADTDTDTDADPISDPTAARAPRAAPRFAQPSQADTATAPSRRMIAVAAGLALLLVVQLLLAERARLAQHTAWRPVVAGLCTVLRCQLPAWRDPATLTVEQRDVRPVEGRPGVLQVSATIRNDSRKAQAWPRITLSLSDIDGRTLGLRTFEPAEYLLQPPANVTLASGESAAIGLEIVEPSPHAVAFNFRFH